MASTTTTLTIHLDFDLNGEPVTRYLTMPGEVEDMKKGRGLTVHLHIDGRKLAKAILPDLVRYIRNTSHVRGSSIGDIPIIIRDPDAEGHE